MKDLDKSILQIKETLIKIEGDLKYHIKRTDLLETFMKNQIKFLLGVLIIIMGAIVGKSAYGAEIADSLVNIQKEVACPIIITSGLRSIKHNKKVGGAKNSYHLKNRARDIVAPCLTTQELAKICKKHVNGVIVYKKHVHIDNREKPFYWDRRK